MIPLGERIFELRLQNGWTRRQLAANTGTSVSYLSAIERGRAIPAVSMLVRLADAFEVTVADMVAGVDFGERAYQRAEAGEDEDEDDTPYTRWVVRVGNWESEWWAVRAGKWE